MDKSLITVTSPLLPDLDDFHAMKFGRASG